MKGVQTRSPDTSVGTAVSLFVQTNPTPRVSMPQFPLLLKKKKKGDRPRTPSQPNHSNIARLNSLQPINRFEILDCYINPKLVFV